MAEGSALVLGKAQAEGSALALEQVQGFERNWTGGTCASFPHDILQVFLQA
ncbi:MAG: hypothetical protein IJ496_10705 [Ruminococcus sp.]|nr:hypothetical protein [Ruminococcus sp.]